MTTELLHRWSAGDFQAFDELIEQAYDRLLLLAGRTLYRVGRCDPMEPCALVHETWLEIRRLDGIDWAGEDHFFAVVSRVMQRILIDRHRRRQRIKRGGGARWVTLEEADARHFDGGTDTLSALEDALVQLRQHDTRKLRIVELRFFAGLTGREIARRLAISSATVQREWRRARTRLQAELTSR